MRGVRPLLLGSPCGSTGLARRQSLMASAEPATKVPGLMRPECCKPRIANDSNTQTGGGAQTPGANSGPTRQGNQGARAQRKGDTICVWVTTGLCTESFRERLAAYLGEQAFRSVTSVKKCIQRSGVVRFDVVTSRRVRVLYLLRRSARRAGWYAREHRPVGHRDRRPEKRRPMPEVTKKRRLGTLNVGTLAGKRSEVAWLLEQKGLSVLAVQETLCTATGPDWVDTPPLISPLPRPQRQRPEFEESPFW